MPQLADDTMERLAALVHRHLGLYFPRARWRDLLRGMEATCRDLEEEGVEGCARRLLTAHPDRRVIEILGRNLTIGETYFFREAQAFRALETRFLPELLAKRQEGGRILRFWSAACATGEEPYSLAILLRRHLSDLENWQVTILATDINTLFLRKAELGVYGNWSFRGEQGAFRQAWFTRTAEGLYQVRPEIRRMVTFACHNLAEDPYPALANNTNAMDVIFCRNVLMYFSEPMRKEVLDKLQRSLVDGGVLVTGAAETATRPPAGLVPVHLPDLVLYQKKAPAPRPLPSPPLPAPSLRKAQEPAPPGPAESLTMLREAYRRGEYAALCRLASELRPADPDFAAAALVIARACANSGSLPAALSSLDAAIARQRLDPEAHYLRAMVLEEQGRTPEALDSLRTTLYLDPDFVPAYVTLGNIARRRGDHGQAARSFRNALLLLEPYQDDDPIPHAEEMRAGRLREAVIAAMEGSHGA